MRSRPSVVEVKSDPVDPRRRMLATTMQGRALVRRLVKTVQPLLEAAEGA